MIDQEIAITQILDAVPEERNVVFRQLHQAIVDHLPEGFSPGISYGGLGYVVPHSVYPAGYHCKPIEPLPFAGIANQKNSINFYHMGLYADPVLYDWFVAEFPKYSKLKLDMGKSCIRFKKVDQIPLELIAKLMQKMSCKDWIALYEKKYRK